MVKIVEKPIKMDDLGVPLFLETPIFIEAGCFRFGCLGIGQTSTNLDILTTFDKFQVPPQAPAQRSKGKGFFAGEPSGRCHN